MDISNIINNMECICTLATRSFNLKCFMIDLDSTRYGENNMSTWDKSLGTCAKLLTNACLWQYFGTLQVLQLRGRQFLNQIPKEMFSITTLMEVDLSGSNCTTIPEELGNLSSLTTLDLRGCKSLTTIPEGLGNLSFLTTLNLGGCESLTTIPEGLGNLNSLRTLDLRGCKSLTTIPAGLGTLSSLTTLGLRG
jgi:Leucine-rich repeat (LRR) protein